MIDLPLFFGTTLSLAAFYLASQKEIARCENPDEKPGFPWWALARLPLVLSLGIGLCVNQTRAVLEALLGKDTEFVRTPKHGIRGKLESWSGKKYRAARSLTPFIELALAGYFVVAMVVAFDHGHYLSMPFLALFLCGFGYVGGRLAVAGRTSAGPSAACSTGATGGHRHRPWTLAPTSAAGQRGGGQLPPAHEAGRPDARSGTAPPWRWSPARIPQRRLPA